jgi:fructoselysine 6-kinase
MSAGFDIIAVGDNCIDRLSGAICADLIGGNAVNVAVQAARLGLRSAYAGAVGPKGEPDGDAVTAALVSNRVNVDLLERRGNATSVTQLCIDKNGERTILKEDFGACAGWSVGEVATEYLLSAKHVHIGWLDDGGALRRKLASANISVSQDISVNADSDNIGVGGLNIAFAALATHEIDQAETRLRALVEQRAGSAVITLGSAGSIALVAGQITRAPALTITPIDTTGAGDSYIAAFLKEYMQGHETRRCMAAGHALAARTCQHLGGFPR